MDVESPNLIKSNAESDKNFKGVKSAKRHLFPEDGLRLAAETLLFSVVTSSALGRMTFLRLLILCNFVRLVLLAFLAIGASRLRDVHLENMTCVRPSGM
jgi:hypothetical protein